MTCITCGADIHDTATLCPHCGAAPLARRRQQVASGDDPARKYHDLIKTGATDPAIRLRRSVDRNGSGVIMPSAAIERRSQEPKRPAHRNASERPGSARPKEKPGKRAGSMQPSQHRQGTTVLPDRRQGAASSAGQARMVRRHEYEAIIPEGNDTFNWSRMLIISFLCVVILTVGVYLFLARTAIGQIWLAYMGCEATSEAYHAVGKQYMQSGSISRAIHALEIAQSKDPDNLYLLVNLGKAYMGNNQVDRAELAYTRAIYNFPAYPEPYQHVIDILLDKGRNYEAVQLVEIAFDKTQDPRFETMLYRLLPSAPIVNYPGKRYSTEIDLKLECPDMGAVIYYTLRSDENPIEKGVRYEGPIHLTESTWRLRAVSEKDGMYSRETVQTYVIIKDQPDMPKPNLGPGKYKAGTTVKLRPGKKDEEVDIYYTVDGTRPTTNSKKYSDETPVVLGIGRITLRAISVNIEGKASNELNILYEGTGTTKSSMSEKDTVDGLTLYKTTQDQFIAKYGQPQSEAPDGTNVYGVFTRLTYPFGYAVFVASSPANKPVLAELYTGSSAFQGPRGTAVGKRMEDVIGAFRDNLNEANASGDRVLYNRTTGQYGFLTKLSEKEYKISYYVKLETNGMHIELTYCVRDGLVTRMEWLQY